MDRRQFLYSVGILAATPLTMKLKTFENISQKFSATDKMPVLFVGHGNPMNAISDNSVTQQWTKLGSNLPVPTAILCISAHWETQGTFVTAMDQPKTIHDFYGFPQALFDVQYPAPGAPEYAQNVKDLVHQTKVGLDHEWGLDHGTWSILVKMFPEANIPVFQLSLDYTKSADYHYQLAKELNALRRKGVLIIGSGNIVHNLRMAQLSGEMPAYDWAIEFDELAKKLILEHDHKALINYKDLGTSANLSIPTPDHYLPLLYSLALQEDNENIEFFNEEMAFRSGSMRSLIIQ